VEMQDWMDTILGTPSTQMYTHFFIQPTIEDTRDYVITRLHNSRFINYSYDVQPNFKYFTYYLITSEENSRFLIIDDCIFWRGQFLYGRDPYIDTLYNPSALGTSCICINASKSDLKIQYISRSIHNYLDSTYRIDVGTINEISGYASSITAGLAVAGFGMLEKYTSLLVPFNSKPL
jgi:hypothetical protein